MNRKGESVGLIIMVAVTLIVGAILLVASAQNLGEVRNTVSLANASITVTNGSAYNFTDYKAISNLVVYNRSGDYLLTANNYTFTNNVVVDGNIYAQLTPLTANDVFLPYWNVSGDAQLLGYDTSAGGRTIAGLIVIFFALAVAVVALIPTLKAKYS